MPIESFRGLVNETIHTLQKQAFTVEDSAKISGNVSALKVVKAESELVFRSVVFWIDIATRRCFIKTFIKQGAVDRQPRVVENEDILLNQTNQMVQRKQVHFKSRFHNYGLFEI